MPAIQGLQFDGVDDIVSVSNNPVYNNSFTLETRIHTAQDVGTRQLIWGKGGGVGDTLYISGGNLYWTINDADIQKVSISTPIQGDSWYDITAVLDRGVGEMLLYLDGELKASSGGVSVYTDANEPAEIGSSTGNRQYHDGYSGAVNPYAGFIAYFRKWRMPLTAAQMQGGYVTGSEPELEFAHNMDEGSGSSLNDVSPNGLDGTISGATWSSLEHTNLVKQGLHLNGTSDYVEFAPYSPLIDTHYDRTTQILFRAEDVTRHQALYEQGANNTNSFQIHNGNLVGVHNGPFTTKHFMHPIQTGVLYHAVITRDSDLDEIKFYVNGDLVETFSGNTQVNYAGNTSGIGKPVGAWHNYLSGHSTSTSGYEFQGDVFRVYAWDHARPAADLNDPYEPLTGTEPGLIFLFDMEEGSGSILNNGYSDGSDGSINGATWTSIEYEEPTSPIQEKLSLIGAVGISGANNS